MRPVQPPILMCKPCPRSTIHASSRCCGSLLAQTSRMDDTVPRQLQLLHTSHDVSCRRRLRPRRSHKQIAHDVPWHLSNRR